MMTIVEVPPGSSSTSTSNDDVVEMMTTDDTTTMSIPMKMPQLSITNATTTPTDTTFDFDLTEGQIRRGNMTDCEYECSEIFDYLYVGGARVAESWDTLTRHKITRVVNCSMAVVKNFFSDHKNMTYLGLNMVDGREDDISWFVCQVIDFIVETRRLNERVLVHCEKGVSRSCSFVIAYIMWLNNVSWKQSFDYVKSKRRVCAPNTAFTCNLIEFGELLNSSAKEDTFYFRCSSHLPHDPLTPVLKLCRDPQTRRILCNPTSSDFSPEGVFVIKPSQRSNDTTLYAWKGADASEEVAGAAMALAEIMVRVFKSFTALQLIEQGSEPEAFIALVQNTGPFNKENQAIVYNDLFLAKTSNTVVDASEGGIESINQTATSISANKRKEPCSEETTLKIAVPVPVFVVSGSPDPAVDRSAEKRRASKDTALPSLSVSGFKLGSSSLLKA